MSNRESNQMTPYFIRVKGSYKQFEDARSLRVNTCYLVKLGSNMDEIDAQSIVSNYVGRHAGWNHRLDIYEVEVYEKDFRSPDLYFTINIKFPLISNKLTSFKSQLLTFIVGPNSA